MEKEIISQEVEKSAAEGFVEFQIDRNITNLYKSFLIILEDLSDPPYNLPEEVRIKLRKKILDSGNDTIRELNVLISKFDLKFKK